jgi:predicted  nucleic acid-binding Zn-ribbon protein
MVKHDDLVRLREEYEVTRKKKDDLASKGLHLEQENTRLKENLELVELESAANALGKEVSALKLGKEILQDQISTLTDEVQS